MYKLLLCWRYLRTRYIALASIISVTLGVATMIVVNSVMEGFTSEMQNRIHGILSDVVFESRSFDGMPDAEWLEEQIRQVAGDQIEAMSPTVVVPAMLNFQYNGNDRQQVQLIGIDEKTQSSVSDFSKYLQHPANRKAMSFELRQGGYDVRDHQAGPDVPERKQMADAGWGHRREVARHQDSFSSNISKPKKQAASAGGHALGRPLRDASRPQENAVRSRQTSSTPARCWASPWPAFARPRAKTSSWSCPATT